MTLETIYYIGQTVAVVLIFGSLIAIYLQQRQSHTFELNASHRDLLKQAREHFDLLSYDEVLFDDVRLCLNDYKSETPFRRHRFRAWCMNAFTILDQANYLNRDGLMNAAAHERTMAYGLAVLRTPGGRQWWEESLPLVNDELVEYYSTLLRDDPDGPSLIDLMPELKIESSTQSQSD